MLGKAFFKIWYDKKFFIFGFFLIPISLIYYIFWKIIDLYYSFLFSPVKMPCPVISVGNITLGGTGKTPFIIYLICLLRKIGFKNIVVLTRGYKGRKLGLIQDVDGEPDEARLIKKRFKDDITVIANPNRIKAFYDYFSNKNKPDLIILDDGFQHRKIYRDIDIVMIDSGILFGNKLLFPAGPLREPINSIRRCNIVIFKGNLQKKINFLNKDAYVFFIKKVNIFDMNNNSIEFEAIKNKEVIAFCGIANPMSFKETILRNNLNLKLFFAFDDHYNYTYKDIQKITQNYNNDYLFLTTEKDWVKVKNIWPDNKELYILVPDFEIDEKEQLKRMIYEKICVS